MVERRGCQRSPEKHDRPEIAAPEQRNPGEVGFVMNRRGGLRTRGRGSRCIVGVNRSEITAFFGATVSLESGGHPEEGVIVDGGAWIAEQHMLGRSGGYGVPQARQEGVFGVAPILDEAEINRQRAGRRVHGKPDAPLHRGDDAGSGDDRHPPWGQ